MLDIINFSRQYNTGFRLNDISMHINTGDFVVMFGEDDAGKTVLLYHVVGLHHTSMITQVSKAISKSVKGSEDSDDEEDEGVENDKVDSQILFEGKPIEKLTHEEQKLIRYVPDHVCMENITAKAYFKMLSRNYKHYEEEDVKDLCEYFEVDWNQKLTNMTYNENKLAMIIGAMVTMPKLLILDEPMNFLTQESGVKLLEFLKFLTHKGIAILITCSEAKEVKDYCNRYIYMKEGSIVSDGIMKDIYGAQKAVSIRGGDSQVIQRLLGAPIGQANDRVTYLYDRTKQSRSLTEIMTLMGNVDVEIENLTLEENLDKDYTRWM